MAPKAKRVVHESGYQIQKAEHRAGLLLLSGFESLHLSNYSQEATMAYLTAEDNPKPQYIVVTVHSEYEQTVRLFITEDGAQIRRDAEKHNGNEVYMAKIIE